jgi:hypothetical protein
MSRRLVVALVTVGFLGSVVVAAPASQAESSTVCVGRGDAFELRPGLSMAAGSGTGVTVVAGQVQCTGPLDGYQPTGPITSRHFFTYGDHRANTCTHFEARGWVDYYVPTSNGIVVLRNNFTGGIKLSDPADAMVIHGDHLTGRAFVQSVEGDCVTTPLTKMEVGWVGQWHDKGRNR